MASDSNQPLTKCPRCERELVRSFSSGTVDGHLVTFHTLSCSHCGVGGTGASPERAEVDFIVRSWAKFEDDQ